jgi:pilus assembly protein Flp/PilA
LSTSGISPITKLKKGEKNMLTKVKSFIHDESGASAVEYGLLVAGIAVVVMAAIYGIGTALNQKFQNVQTQLSQ